MKKKQNLATNFSLKSLKKDIIAEACVLKLHVGFAEIIAEKVSKKVETYLATHPVVTEDDIERIVVSELKKYSKDLAYIYHNRDKII